MARRELSSTLKNLKFMQRATQREEKTKKVEVEEAIPDGNFPTSTAPRKCVVIMEGDPHPGATRGRMSFQSFNPAVDKLNEEADNVHQPEGSNTSSCNKGSESSNRENSSVPDGLENPKVDKNDSHANEDHKRKQAEVITETPYPNKSLKNGQGDQNSTSSGRSSHKQSKREKLDWNVLRPPKPQNRNG